MLKPKQRKEDQFWGLAEERPAVLNEAQLELLTRLGEHRDWSEPQGWKGRVNNVQLLIQPFIYFCSIKPWLAVFDIPGLPEGLMSLIEHINQFPLLAASCCSSALFLCLA